MIGKTSDGRGATASEDKSRWSHCATLSATCVLIIGFFAWGARSGFNELLCAQRANGYYNLLVQGFQAGQLNVKREAPPELAQLADPYDVEANRPYRLSDGRPVEDMSYYKGKLYLYFGVTPVLVLFWPYAALTGHFLLNKEAVVIFCSVGFLAGVWLLWSLWRRYFGEFGFGGVVAGGLALGLGTGIPLFIAECNFYEVAISCGYALAMVALVAIWKALHEPERRGWWLVAASLAYGLAVGARPNLLFGAVILLVPVIQTWREGRRVWPMLTAAACPIVVIGLGLMLYNFLRFDNPLEFGGRYQLAGTERQDVVQHFRLRYLWYNFQLYFLEPATWSKPYPFVRDVLALSLPAGHEQIENSFGLLTNIPLFWLALAAPLAWRGRMAETDFTLRRFVAAVALLFGICMVTLCLFYSVAIRFLMDFLPALALLAVIGIFGVERALSGRRVWRKVARLGWGALLAISVTFNLYENYQRSAAFHDDLGFILFQRGQTDEAIAHFQRAVKIQPDNTEAHINLGFSLLKKGQIDEGIAHYRRALEINPKDATTHYTLGTALLQKREVDEAITQFRKALELQPNYSAAQYYLGMALIQKGQVNQAITQFKSALERKSNNPNIYNQLAWLLATSPDASIRNGSEAVQLARQARELVAGENPVILRTLAAAYAENGQHSEAVATAQRALQLATAQNNAGLANDLEAELKFYQAGSPFRDTPLTNSPAPSTQNTFREDRE